MGRVGAGRRLAEPDEPHSRLGARRWAGSLSTQQDGAADFAHRLCRPVAAARRERFLSRGAGSGVAYLHQRPSPALESSHSQLFFRCNDGFRPGNAVHAWAGLRTVMENRKVAVRSGNQAKQALQCAITLSNSHPPSGLLHSA